MSYILDALKKSEQERGHGHIPSVQTVHTSSLNYHNKKAAWPYVLITAVLLNLAAIIYFYLDKDKSPVDDTVASEQESISGNGTSSQNTLVNTTAVAVASIPQETDHQNTETSNQELQYSDPSENTTVEPSPTAAQINKSTKLDVTSVVEYHDLPESIKTQLPTITVSAHVYSTNPLQRSIVINNNFLEEGEYVLDDLILQEITRDGAIMFYQGRSFHYSVISGWR